MVNYSNGCVYKLCCKDPNITDIYVGSTTRFIRRKCEHKSRCNNDTGRYFNFPVYQFIRSNGGFENWDMIELEKCNVKDKKELETRERYLCEILCARLNGNVPTQTNKEYREANRDALSIRSKEYREANKEACNIRSKEYREANRDAINIRKKEYYYVNKEACNIRSKEYREANKEACNIYNKEYREANRDAINMKQKQKLNCDCGSICSKTHFKRHLESTKHILWQTIRDFIYL